MKSTSGRLTPAVFFIVLVAALGYFVDIYDLVLFSIIRIKSLQGIGITNPSELTSLGLLLLNIQMGGMLIGGFVWGIIADKKGRLTVLFGSILLYSVANILNGLVHDIYSFGVLRFVAGFGLAGELGAGITLVSETMSKENRGYGTMLVAGVGLLGAVVASLVAGHFTWQISFFVGGGLGIFLLIMRIGVSESGMYKNLSHEKISKGNLGLLFSSKERIKKYLCCCSIALPLWFMVGILITLGPEFGKVLHIKGLVSAGKGILWTYMGITVGDILTGLLSQFMKSRKKVVALFLVFTLLGFVLYVNAFNQTLEVYYWICFAMGVSTGFWVIFVTLAAEQFGTNLRGTVTTSVPNVIRGSVIPLTAGFQLLKTWLPFQEAALAIGMLTILLAFLGLSGLKESFGKDLDYVEV